MSDEPKNSDSKGRGERDRPLILLADDDLDIRALVRHALEELAVDFIEAEDGEQAISKILIEQPDLVVLDVMMPEVTGWEVCKWLRTREGYAETLILMLTAVGEEVNALTAPLYGADAYLDKPFDFEEMAAKVSELLAQGASKQART